MTRLTPPSPASRWACIRAGTTCTAPLPGGALQTVQTDATGQYTFAGLNAGSNYVVCQQQPAGHADRAPLPGTAGSTPGANQINITNLPATGSIDNDFPEVLGRISGTVFLDYFAGGPADFNNGAQNAGEPGIGSNVPGAGVTLTLTGTPSAGPGAGVAITPRTTTTLADGSYSFADLLPGSYTVTEGSIPLALGTYSDGINTAGTVTVGAPGVAGAVGVNTISNIVLGAAGASSSGNNFAELPRTTISGLVFIDFDKNNVFNAIDTQRLPGVVVELRQGGSLVRQRHGCWQHHHGRRRQLCVPGRHCGRSRRGGRTELPRVPAAAGRLRQRAHAARGQRHQCIAQRDRRCQPATDRFGQQPFRRMGGDHARARRSGDQAARSSSTATATAT